MTSPAGSLRRVLAWHPALIVLSACMVVMAAVSAIGLVVDPRVLVGAPIWLKPFKFAVSITLYSVTWAWLLSQMGRHRRRAARLSNVLVALFALEYVIIIGQVLRGQLSHFNETTALNGMLFAVMGTSITAVWAGTLVLAVLLARERAGDAANNAAIKLGAAISVLGAGLGALMVGPTAAQRASMANGTYDGIMGAHSVGAPDGGPVMPITGWNTEVGDLRVPHFFGLHALQAIPLVAIGLALLGGRVALLAEARTRAALVWVAAGGYAGVVAVLVWQAERGQAVVRPDGLTLSALGVVVALVAVSAATVLLRAASGGSGSPLSVPPALAVGELR